MFIGEAMADGELLELLFASALGFDHFMLMEVHWSPGFMTILHHQDFQNRQLFSPRERETRNENIHCSLP